MEGDRPRRPRAEFILPIFAAPSASLDKDGTPFTPPVTLVYGLLEALRMIDEEGLGNVLARHERLRRGFACRRAGARPSSSTTSRTFRRPPSSP